MLDIKYSMIGLKSLIAPISVGIGSGCRTALDTGLFIEKTRGELYASDQRLQ